MRDPEIGMFIRKWPDTRIGMIMEMTKDHVFVAFVNSGPLHAIQKRNIIPATQRQINAAGLEGIGCVWPPP